jgi:hypothetical protein
MEHHRHIERRKPQLLGVSFSEHRIVVRRKFFPPKKGLTL